LNALAASNKEIESKLDDVVGEVDQITREVANYEDLEREGAKLEHSIYVSNLPKYIADGIYDPPMDPLSFYCNLVRSTTPNSSKFLEFADRDLP